MRLFWEVRDASGKVLMLTAIQYYADKAASDVKGRVVLFNPEAKITRPSKKAKKFQL